MMKWTGSKKFKGNCLSYINVLCAYINCSKEKNHVNIFIVAQNVFDKINCLFLINI